MENLKCNDSVLLGCFDVTDGSKSVLASTSVAEDGERGHPRDEGSASEAEALAARHGICSLRQFANDSVHLESDCKLVIGSLLNPGSDRTLGKSGGRLPPPVLSSHPVRASLTPRAPPSSPTRTSRPRPGFGLPRPRRRQIQVSPVTAPSPRARATAAPSPAHLPRDHLHPDPFAADSCRRNGATPPPGVLTGLDPPALGPTAAGFG
ncbi:hypothetical protein BRADI_1g37786v3 [Brachypodium distachyon]|uniref:Uncharacterized protein n=1 Tax=Brachypodium distachyon TaxID=15368 RepID=A0A0Q3JK41_BRADI|nr:hypothetical protein BRADI_1g37786v3 [Brachypodium distachyon]